MGSVMLEPLRRAHWVCRLLFTHPLACSDLRGVLHSTCFFLSRPTLLREFSSAEGLREVRTANNRIEKVARECSPPILIRLVQPLNVLTHARMYNKILINTYGSANGL